MEYIASKASELGVAVYQPEDEIAAINVAVGAGYAGVRAMTATSGSGLCLMIEGLGLAGLTETPVVIVDAQRPGPAVGLATRTGQGDLQFVLNAHHDDFPRAVLAPRTIEDAFWTSVRAFNLAEKYQLPVIVLTDAHLATSYATVGELDFSKIDIDRGEVYEGKPEEYKRHRITECGISPRAFPGQGKTLVITNACEYNEEGHRSEDAETRTAMMQKRMRKMEGLRKEMATPQRYGSEKAEITLLGWGSACGAIKEAVDILQDKKTSANCLLFNELYPFPVEAARSSLQNGNKVYTVEGNFSGQFARLMKDSADTSVDGEILKYDGRPLTPAFIVEKVSKEVK
jgi:2-oxoglutarate ferredoxin oxidoreductase subunit alpha